jgi:hypothetical protein
LIPPHPVKAAAAPNPKRKFLLEDVMIDKILMFLSISDGNRRSLNRSAIHIRERRSEIRRIRRGDRRNWVRTPV